MKRRRKSQNWIGLSHAQSYLSIYAAISVQVELLVVCQIWIFGVASLSPSLATYGHETISTGVLSLYLIQLGQSSITGESMCT